MKQIITFPNFALPLFSESVKHFFHTKSLMLVLGLFLGLMPKASAQNNNNLIDATGDIAFVAYTTRSNGVSGFAFVLLDNCPAGTTIHFTDEEWTGTAFASFSGVGEGDLSWQNTTGATIPRGTVIKVAGPVSNIGVVVWSSTNTSVNLGTLNIITTNYNHADADQVYAMTAPRPTSGTFTGTFLAFVGGIATTNFSFNGTPFRTGTAPSASLTAYGTNVTVGRVYTGSTICNGTAAQCNTMVNMAASWSTTAAWTTTAEFNNAIPDNFTFPSACTNPTAYTVTGGSGVAISLSNSQSGVNYQLKRDGTTNVGSAQAGSGSSLSFGVQSVAGTYTIVATTATGGCTATMTGNVVIPITRTWNGSVQTTLNGLFGAWWTTAANWTPTGVPAVDEPVIVVSPSSGGNCAIPNGTNIVRNAPTTINGGSISVSTGASLTNSSIISQNNSSGFPIEGTLTNQVGGVININDDGSEGFYLAGGTINNEGTFTIAAQTFFQFEGIFNNTGTFTNDGVMTGSGTFNSSTLVNPMNANLGSTEGLGTYPDCMNLTNGLTNEGTMNFDLATGPVCDNYDKFTVTGTANLGGTFAVINNGVSIGNTFLVIEATAISGTFTNNSINLGGGKYANMYYTATKATIKIENAPLGSTPNVNLSVSANTGTEAAATSITVTATASAAVSGAQTVSLAVTGTGITTGDYTLNNTTASSVTITIPTGQTTGTATFKIVDDAAVEGTETAVLTISSPSSGISLGSTTTQNITITDNDFPTVNLSVSTNAGTEAGTTAVTVTATASAAVSGAQTVNLAVTGTGITAGDYSLSSTTITIPTGQTTGSVTFTVVDDAVIEGAETATLTISSPSSGITLGSTTTQNITITDNDFPTVNLSVSANAGTEVAATSITVTATASAAVSGAQTVNLAVTGTGITTGDYTLNNTTASSVTITIPTGQTTGTVTFTVVDDAAVEGTETATLTISSPSSGISLGSTTTQNIAITDNDFPTVNLSVSTNTGTEAAATVVTVTATASVAVSGAQTISLGVSGTGITAGDYSLSNTTITIPTGQTTGSVTFTVVDDAAVEGTETAVLTISSPSSGISLGSTTTQNIAITDNDFPTVNLSVSANTGTEAAATVVTVTATASVAVSGAQTISLGVSGTGITAGDYSLSNTTITIPTGQTTGSVTFTVVDDAAVEGTETAVLTISSPSSGISLGSTTTQNIAITDNDFPTVNLSVSANTGTEAAATVVTVTATASVAVSGAQTVSLGVSGTGITAGDYSLSSTTITIPTGQTTGSVTFTVVDDALVEGTETATLTISSPSSGISLGSTTTQNITITDNDVAFVCPTLAATSSASYDICSGDNTSDIALTSTRNDLDMKLVYFTSAQSGTAMYTGGTAIGSTVTPSGSSSPYAVAFNNLSFPANTTSSNVTYYVYAILDVADAQLTDANCRPNVAFTVTVNAAGVGGTIGSVQPICTGTSPADLVLSGNTGEVVKWQKSTDMAFTSPTDITSTSTTLTGATIGKLTANTYFRAVVKSGVCAEANSSSVLITVNAPPFQLTLRSNSPQCERSGLSLESSVPFSFDPSVSFTYAWTGPNGFTAATASATISSLLPVNAGTYNLLVTNTQTGCSDTKSLTVVVFPLPAIPTITAHEMQMCKGENVLLTGTCSATTDIFRWTTPPLLGNSLATLSNINRRIITTPGVYKGLCESKDGCLSDEVSINITERNDCSGLNFITVTPSKAAICPNGSVQLTASGCAGGTLTWYGGASPQTGTSIIASPITNTTYFVQCSTGGSGSVIVVVAQPTIQVPNSIVTGQDWIKATQTITSDKKIGEAGFTPAPSVLYEAGSSITLLPGFVAEKWSTFKAEIKGCN